MKRKFENHVLYFEMKDVWNICLQYIFTDLIDAFKTKCFQGELEHAQLIFEFGITELDIKQALEFDTETFQSICANNCLDVVKWFEKVKFVQYNNETLSIIETCKKGHLVMVQWLWHMCALMKICISKSDVHRAFHIVCAQGYSDLVRWILDLNIIDNAKKALGFSVACENGHISIVQSMNITLRGKFLEDLIQKLFTKNNFLILEWLQVQNADYCKIVRDIAMKNLTQEVVKWLFNQNFQVNKDFGLYKKVCEFQNPQAAQWMIIAMNLQPNDVIIQEGFYFACTKSILVAEYLLQSNLIQNMSSIEMLYVCRNVCRSTNLKQIQWLWEKGFITKYYSFIGAFMDACSYGNLEIAQWLWTLNLLTANNQSYGWPFRDACSNGHLHIAKWLWNVNSKFCYRGLAEKEAFAKNQTKVVDWLKSLE